jgi:hypothetical protein
MNFNSCKEFKFQPFPKLKWERKSQVEELEKKYGVKITLTSQELYDILVNDFSSKCADPCS